MIETISSIGYKNTYYLQNYLETSSNIGNIQPSRPINKEKIKSDILKLKGGS